MDIIVTILEYKNQLKVTGYAKSSINHYIFYLNQFKEYLRTLKILGGRFKLNEQDVVLAFDYTDEDFYGEVQGF